MGGWVKDSSGTLKYIFSGPSQLSNIADIEMEAMNHITQTICSKVLSEGVSILFCSDAKEIVDIFCEQYLHGNLSESFPWLRLSLDIYLGNIIWRLMIWPKRGHAKLI